MEISGVDNLIKYAREYIQYIRERSPESAAVVGLYGDLGAGKTTFVQCVARELGIDGAITSPTFVIQKSYPIEKDSRFKTLIHIDAYRIHDPQEVAVLGWEENIADPANLIFIEWAGNIEKALPENTERITLTVIDEDTRNVEDGRE